MPSTTNFNWTTPADTDLVKDGAAAIRTLGNNIDASLVDLKGGTTGQVLAKASNTDLDFTWSSVDPLTILDAKGDLITATAADTPARLAVGANNTVLTADSTTSTGLKWAAVASGGFTSLASGSLSGSAVNLTSISGTYEDLVLVLRDWQVNANAVVGVRVNNNSAGTSVYRGAWLRDNSGAVGTGVNGNTSYFSVIFGNAAISGNQDNITVLRFFDYADTSAAKAVNITGHFQDQGGVYLSGFQGGAYISTSAITELNILAVSTTFTGGTYELFGVK